MTAAPPETTYDALEAEKRRQAAIDKEPCALCMATIFRRQSHAPLPMFAKEYEAAIDQMREKYGWPRTIRHYCRGIVERLPDAGAVIETVSNWPCQYHQPEPGRA